MQSGLLHGNLFPDALRAAPHNEGTALPHLPTRLDSYITYPNKTTKDEKYPLLDKEDK